VLKKKYILKRKMSIPMKSINHEAYTSPKTQILIYAINNKFPQSVIIINLSISFLYFKMIAGIQFILRYFGEAS
jgi:hypothetical protein